MEAQQAGYDGIRYFSERGLGTNLVIFNNFDQLLKPQMIVPAAPIEPVLEPMYYSSLGAK